VLPQPPQVAAPCCKAKSPMDPVRPPFRPLPHLPGAPAGTAAAAKMQPPACFETFRQSTTAHSVPGHEVETPIRGRRLMFCFCPNCATTQLRSVPLHIPYLGTHARTSYLYRSHLLLKPISPSHPGSSLALIPTPPFGSPSLMGRTLSTLFHPIRVRHSATPSLCGPHCPRLPEALTRALTNGFILSPADLGKFNKVLRGQQAPHHCHDPSHAGPQPDNSARWAVGCRGSCNSMAKSEDITLTYTRCFGPLFQSFSRPLVLSFAHQPLLATLSTTLF
jgi:hypothetical protein